jgi:catechol 2,3-dioxygenase-like lactoylglutathione lyase family enzyme
MISGGNATVYVSSLDKAIDFYTNTLGLKLRFRAADYWAEIDAGGGLVIGLHPESPKAIKPGTRGSMMVGLGLTEPLDKAVKTLEGRGVKFEEISDTPDEPVRLAYFSDPDGNPLYLVETKSYG